MGILDNILTTLRDQPWWSKSKDSAPNQGVETPDLVDLLIDANGEHAASIHAQALMERINSFDDDGLIDFFNHLLTMDIDAGALATAAAAYETTPSATHLGAIKQTATPLWQRVFERINASHNGTVCLVRLRAQLLRLGRQYPNFMRLDVTLNSLMQTWFNRGFLVLEPINWSTPANILEKIIQYEAVHEIASWDDLRARLEPEDRRCFAYFHPAMPDEPLIFVEVALMAEIPTNISDVLSTPRDIINQHDARVAVFYSISNCQNGLSGVSFGNFLIKRVAGDLKRNLPDLTQFVTLSPVPTFRKWLAEHDAEFEKALPHSVIAPDQERDEKLMNLAARYFVISDRPDGAANDPVARFHLGNGAALAAINLFGDQSIKALESAAGLMVNYEYKLDAVEDRHDDYQKNGTLYIADAIKARVPLDTK